MNLYPSISLLFVAWSVTFLVGVSASVGPTITTQNGNSGLSHSRVRRASLHELLLRNRKIAAIPASSSAFVANENRRVLVVESPEQTSNYVHDKDEGIHEVNNVKPELYKYDLMDQSTHGHVGDRVTDYATHYSSIEAPSYADPNLLAAVMSQADEANFRYPVNSKKPVFRREKDQTFSESAKYEKTVDLNNDINPFELFPPSFHELLEIPIHTYANGSSYNPHDKFKSEIISPTITGGYANTNVNGLSSLKKKNYISKRPLINKYINDEAPNTRNSHSSFASDQRKKLEHATLIRNSYKESSSKRLPPPTNGALRKRPVRPSLRFRTRTTPRNTMKFTTTTTPFPLISLTTLRVRNVSRVIPKRPSNSNKNIYDDRVSNPNSAATIYQDFEITEKKMNEERDRLNLKGGRNESTVTRSTESEQVLYVDNKKQKYDSEKSNKKKKYPSKKNTLNQSEAINSDKISKDNPFYQHDHHEYGNRYTDQRKIQGASKHPSANSKSEVSFKPSKIDPFASSYPSLIPLLRPKNRKPDIRATTYKPLYTVRNNRGKFISPTTFKPYLSRNEYVGVLPPVVNTYKIPSQDRQVYYEDNDFNPIALRSSSLFKPPRFRTQDSFSRSEHNSQKGPDLVPPFIKNGYTSQNFHTNGHSYPNINSHIRHDFNGEHAFTNNQPLYHAPRRPKPRRPLAREYRRPSIVKWPSFFERFNIFRPSSVNRRSGDPGPGANVNHIVRRKNKFNKEKLKYILSNGPTPHNGKKMVVFGPFIQPPIGAPKLSPAFSSNIGPANILKPPVSFLAIPKIESTNRSSSFKVIQLPTEISNATIKDGALLKLNKKKHNNSTSISSDSLISEIKHQRTSLHNMDEPDFAVSKNTLRISNTKNSFIQPINSFLKVGHDNVYLFKEVTNEDKDKLIAAKFEFPRRQSIRRSGIDRKVIPIPVPMVTSGSKGNFYISHLPVIDKVATTFENKNTERIYIPEKKSDRAMNVAINEFPSTNDNIISPRSLNIEDPQSYREPTVSGLIYGGWQGVERRPVMKSKRYKNSVDTRRSSEKIMEDV